MLTTSLSPNQLTAVGKPCKACKAGAYTLYSGKYGAYVKCSLCTAKVYKPRGKAFTGSAKVSVEDVLLAALHGHPSSVVSSPEPGKTPPPLTPLTGKGWIAANTWEKPNPDSTTWYGILATVWSLLGLGRGPHRVLLYGPPGPGKSTFPALFGKCYRFPFTEDTSPEDVLGQYTLQSGTTVWVDGVAPKSFREGATLVLEELDKASTSAFSFLYAALDDTRLAELTLPTGETVRPAPGYITVATMNATPDALPEALLNRFEIVLYAGTPMPGQLKQLSPPVAAAVKAHYRGMKAPKWGDRWNVRRALAFENLRKVGIDTELAAKLTFGDNAAEAVSVVASHAKGKTEE